ncbi:hypothetical protein CEXT_542241 [Caerostris extrusa]|uniref:Uncharacterized protein n=1 Tax=Caerostris extrusa TaxID=172846 RepID=A0AAV4SZK7_CAEEX|nr:hypothetical protein CEXT_542241 [Caerostris extrusa]
MESHQRKKVNEREQLNNSLSIITFPLKKCSVYLERCDHLLKKSYEDLSVQFDVNSGSNEIDSTDLEDNIASSTKCNNYSISEYNDSSDFNDDDALRKVKSHKIKRKRVNKVKQLNNFCPLLTFPLKNCSVHLERCDSSLKNSNKDIRNYNFNSDSHEINMTDFEDNITASSKYINYSSSVCNDSLNLNDIDFERKIRSLQRRKVNKMKKLNNFSLSQNYSIHLERGNSSLKNSNKDLLNYNFNSDSHEIDSTYFEDNITVSSKYINYSSSVYNDSLNLNNIDFERKIRSLQRRNVNKMKKLNNFSLSQNCGVHFERRDSSLKKFK